jgi:hypothetical protein
MRAIPVLVLLMLAGGPARVTKGRGGQTLTPRCSELATQAESAGDEYRKKAQAATACYAETERDALAAGKFVEVVKGVKLALVPQAERARCKRLSEEAQRYHETTLFESECSQLRECGTTCSLKPPTAAEIERDVREFEAIWGKKCPPPPPVKQS